MLQRRMTCHSLGDFSSSAAQLCCRLQSAVTSSGSLKKSPDSNYLNYNQFHQCLYFANVPNAPSAKSPTQTEKYKMDDSLRVILSSYIKGPINQTNKTGGAAVNPVCSLIYIYVHTQSQAAWYLTLWGSAAHATVP
jgi:hypothetical protein